MNGAVVLFALLPALVQCSGEGNIRLMEDEVAAAILACAIPSDDLKITSANRRRRSEEIYPRIDNNDSNTGQNQYSHERRNGTSDQILVLNATDYDYSGYSTGGGDKVPSVQQPNYKRDYYSNETAVMNRTRRNEPLFNKPDTDQCLSQCIFANLQVVDTRGIPREAELWSKVQSSVTSQQSRAALRDQIRACFQELQSEAEDNGCSYSNKLERCLMLRFSDRKGGSPESNQKT